MLSNIVSYFGKSNLVSQLITKNKKYLLMYETQPYGAVAPVSGAHAMIEVSDAEVMITDLSSTNGTFIEGDELQAGIEYELKEGGEVVFGDEFLALYILQKT